MCEVQDNLRLLQYLQEQVPLLFEFQQKQKADLLRCSSPLLLVPHIAFQQILQCVGAIDLTSLYESIYPIEKPVQEEDSLEGLLISRWCEIEQSRLSYLSRGGTTPRNRIVRFGMARRFAREIQDKLSTAVAGEESAKRPDLGSVDYSVKNRAIDLGHSGFAGGVDYFLNVTLKDCSMFEGFTERLSSESDRDIKGSLMNSEKDTIELRRFTGLSGNSAQESIFATRGQGAAVLVAVGDAEVKLVCAAPAFNVGRDNGGVYFTSNIDNGLVGGYHFQLYSGSDGRSTRVIFYEHPPILW